MKKYLLYLLLANESEKRRITIRDNDCFCEQYLHLGDLFQRTYENNESNESTFDASSKTSLVFQLERDIHTDKWLQDSGTHGKVFKN